MCEEDDVFCRRLYWLRPRITMYRNFWVNSLYNGQINYKGTKTKCHFYWYLIEYIEWRHSQLCWYFWPSFVSYCPSNLLSGSPPPSPLCKVKNSTVHILQTVCGWEGMRGMLSCVEDHILQEFLTRFRTYKIYLSPQTKIYEGRGPQTDKHRP